MGVMTQVFSVGADFRTAPRALLDSICVPAASVIERLRQLKAESGIREAAVVSTCIRTEVYCVAEDDGKDAARAQVAKWLAGNHDNNHFFRLEERAAVLRLFRIAGGLESQIIGETEITGQIKKAAAAAREAGAAGAVMSRLFDCSLSAAKAVRTTTAIGRHSLSYPALAAKAAEGIFPNLNEVAVLFVGTGDMTAAGAPLFKQKGAKQITVAGRDIARAQKAADVVGGGSFAIGDLPKRLAEFDVVVTSTASSVPLIGKGAVESALVARRRKPMMFADLAAPCDLESEISAMADVYVYDLAHFGKLAEASLDLRQLELPAAGALVEKYVDDFYAWLRARKNAPAVRDLRLRAEQTRREETDAALARIAAGEDAKKVMDDFSRRLTGKLLHAPSLIISGGAHDDATKDNGDKD